MANFSFTQIGRVGNDGTSFEKRYLRAQDIIDTHGKSVEEHTSDTAKHVSTEQATLIANAVQSSQLGAANGAAQLDATGKVPSTQLPSFVDDVIEGYYDADEDKFYKEEAKTTEIEGEAGKIYVDLSTDNEYRWGGSTFAQISKSITVTTGSANGKVKVNGTDLTVYDDSTVTAAAAAAQSAADDAQSAAEGAQTAADNAATEAAKLDAVYVASEAEIATKNVRPGALVFMDVTNSVDND